MSRASIAPFLSETPNGSPVYFFASATLADLAAARGLTTAAPRRERDYAGTDMTALAGNHVRLVLEGQEEIAAVNEQLEHLDPPAQVEIPARPVPRPMELEKFGRKQYEALFLQHPPPPQSNQKPNQKTPKPEEIITSTEPLRLSEHFLNVRHRDAERRLLLCRYRQEWRQWKAHEGYIEVSEESLQGELYRHLDHLYLELLDKDGKPAGYQKIKPNAALVREVRLALPSRDLIVDGEAPQWLDGRTSPAPADVVAFRNGLLDAGAWCRDRSVKLMPLTPSWFSSVACPYDFDPDAKCPLWLWFLNEALEGDAERIALLQEWFGLQLVNDNSWERLMILMGPPRAGKGATLEMQSAMLGDGQVAVTSFAKLASRFGLHPMLNKLAAVLPDAHLSRSTDAKAALEVLKSISGGDPQAVDRKGVNELPRVRLNVRFTIATNELPQLPDEAGALKPRLLLLYYPRSFAGAEDTTLKPRLRAEAAGVAVWALEGLARLRSRRQFTIPASSKGIVEEFERIVSPVKLFLHESCEVDAAAYTAKDDLYRAWGEWCRERGDEPGTKATFGQQLIAANPIIRAGKRGPRGARFPVYERVRLTDGAVSGQNSAVSGQCPGVSGQAVYCNANN